MGSGDARARRSAGAPVQLRPPGGPRTGQSSAASDPGAGGRGPGRAERALRSALFADGAALDPAGDAAAGEPAAGFLLGALRAAADGADRRQPVVPVVRRPGDGCRDPASDGVHAQSRPAAGSGCRPRLPVGPAGLEAGQAAPVERPLLRRRHGDRGPGPHEELPAERRLGRTAGTGPQRRARLPPRRSARTRPLPRPPIRTPGSIARAPARRAGCATSAMR